MTTLAMSPGKGSGESVEAACRQAAGKEKQLAELRKQRKQADSIHQQMLNRISFLKSEESKLDRDIENAKRRAIELLERKAEKAAKQNDDDIAATAKDILGTVGPIPSSSSKPLRATSGRSSLRANLVSQSSAAAGSTSSPNPSTMTRSTSAQTPGRASQALKPTLSSSAGATRRSPEMAQSLTPPRPSATPKGGSKPSSPSTHATARASTASPPLVGNNLLAASRGRPSTPECGLPGLAKRPSGGVNTMDLLSGQHGGPDQELIEELMNGTSSSSGRPATVQALQGLQQFSTEAAASKVVHFKATSLKKQDSNSSSSGGGGGAPGTAAVASAVGWGVGPVTAPAKQLIADDKEKKALQQELLRKRQLRGVRKAFGLEPTTLQDSSATVVECGAGSWQ